jgi:hypothetical protein
MIKIITEYTRPSVDVDFYNDPKFKTYISTTYIMSGKMKSETTFSIDKLTKTVTTIWNLSTDYLEFTNDITVREHGANRQHYATEHNIIITKQLK